MLSDKERDRLRPSDKQIIRSGKLTKSSIDPRLSSGTTVRLLRNIEQKIIMEDPRN